MQKQIAEIEENLRRQAEVQDALREVTLRRVEALRRARHEAVAELCREENTLVQRAAELEKGRLGLAAQLTAALDPRASAPLRLAELAERLPEPARTRITLLRVQLRERLERNQRDVARAREATEALAQHMRVIVQSVGGWMAGVATYGRDGALSGRVRVGSFHATA